jgi:NTE family protein
MKQLPEQPAPAPTSDARRSLIGGALRLGRAGATAFAPLADLALRSTAFSGAAVRRAALARVPEGKRSLADLGVYIERLGLEWDGRLFVVAVEAGTGRRIVFGRPGKRQLLSVAKAVEASCAIPGVFRPIRSAGRTYVDGGAWSLTNLDVAPVSRGTRVLCLNPTGSLATMASLRGAIGPLSRSVAGVESLALQRRGGVVTTLAPDAEAAAQMGGDFMDGRRRSAAQDAGYAQGIRAAADALAAA